jgi:hypothetical protein
MSKTLPRFLVSDNALLLDLVCRRYPGRLPSDHYGDELDDYQKWQIDSGLAYRGYFDDMEHENDMFYNLANYLVGIMRSSGNDKVETPQPPLPLRKRPEDFVKITKATPIPTIDQLLGLLGGAGTVID